MTRPDASDVLIGLGVAFISAFCLLVWPPGALAFVGLVFMVLGLLKVWRGSTK